MTIKEALESYTVRKVLCICGLLNLAGCDSPSHPKLVPVSGTVTLDGDPLVLKVTREGKRSQSDSNTDRVEFTVVFSPDPAKGNRKYLSSRGRIDKYGQYQLWTQIDEGGSSWPVGHSTAREHEGAPLGWYKVAIEPGLLYASTPEVVRIRKSFARFPDAPGWDHDFEWRQDLTPHPLSIKVLANPKPGHYDIKLESNKPR
jgi:hypothetical protein